ncbi:MAG: DegT/DnrJ/EryC1/StrS family aminotransferase [Vampirovibrionales bacterium]|nr:DegT/DnrJ/EryC1/StrS family aminotransferase [Vampirovibrionales bacterium]
MNAIPVVKSFLPPLAQYTELLEGIWQRNQLTNHGPLVAQLESTLQDYLQVPALKLIANGTIALDIGIEALGWQGEVITTPFSYVASTSALAWKRIKPVFVDIDEKTLTLNPDLVERAITPKTTGILATHVYGNPCDVMALQDIAKRHNLTILYDGAHAFGVKYQGQSIFNYGSMSMSSFHATKIFHTVEGGALITKSPALADRIAHFRNFGHCSEEDFSDVGINGKCSEFHAAMGLCVLPSVADRIAERRVLSDYYDARLLDKWLLRRPVIRSGTSYNYAYYPLIFPTETAAVAAKKALNLENIYPRRYFFPSLSTLPYVDHQPMPMAESIASRVLCLPLGSHVSEAIRDRIATLIENTLKDFSAHDVRPVVVEGLAATSPS